MMKVGQRIGLRPEREDEYIRYHKEVWPEVLELIRKCNIRNYSIFLRDHTLFAYFEYTGSDYEEDMKRMAADPKMQEWWRIMEPMQVPFSGRKPGEWWDRMEEVFYTD